MQAGRWETLANHRGGSYTMRSPIKRPEGVRKTRAFALALAGLLTILLMAACGSSSSSSSSSAAGGGSGSSSSTSSSSSSGGTLTLGTKNFTEEFIVGQLYKQALAAKGCKINYKEN